MKKLYSLVLACVGFASLTPSFAAYHPNLLCPTGHCLPNCGWVDRARAVTFTVGGGGLFFAKKRNMENTSDLLLMAGYDFTDHWGIEALAGFFNTHYHGSMQYDKRQINGNVYAVDALYHFSPITLVEPYVLGGVGVFAINPNRNDANDEGNINAGVGLKFFIHPAVAFRTEVRDFYTWVGGKNDVMLDGGVTFLFDLC